MDKLRQKKNRLGRHLRLNSVRFCNKRKINHVLFCRKHIKKELFDTLPETIEHCLRCSNIPHSEDEEYLDYIKDCINHIKECRRNLDFLNTRLDVCISNIDDH